MDYIAWNWWHERCVLEEEYNRSLKNPQRKEKCLSQTGLASVEQTDWSHLEEFVSTGDGRTYSLSADTTFTEGGSSSCIVRGPLVVTGSLSPPRHEVEVTDQFSRRCEFHLKCVTDFDYDACKELSLPGDW